MCWLQDLVAVIHHEPGHVIQVDWAGTRLKLVDAASAKPVVLHVFVATLPYSGMLFAAVCEDEKMDTWLDCHRQAFEYFGGVPDLVVPDNASTTSNRIDGSSRARQVNKTYEEFLQWYDTAAVPARARHPRDKGAVEACVRVITTEVIAVLAGTGFVDVDDCQCQVQELVDAINQRSPFRRRNTSRQEVFDTDEKQYLHKLPTRRWEKTLWLKPVVARDFHVEYQRVRYSVPFRYAGKTADVRIRGKQMDIFIGGDLVCSHTLSHASTRRYVTDVDHQPDYFQEYTNLWSRAFFERQARKIGPATVAVITSVLDSHVIEAQGYKTCRNILDLGKTQQNASILEAACRELVGDTTRRRAVTYTAVKSAMAIEREKQRQRPTTTPPKPDPSPRTPAPANNRQAASAHLRGAEAFSLPTPKETK